MNIDNNNVKKKHDAWKGYVMTVINHINVIVKYALSFLENNWSLKDYPLRFKKQKNVPIGNEWSVQIINWWVVCGLGKTKSDAYRMLEKSFESCSKNRTNKPRPGKKVKIEFASTEGIEKNNELIDEFIENILGFTVDEPVFISDESSLWDFTSGSTIDGYFKKIKEYYGLDLSKIQKGNIREILDKVRKFKT
jgi:hypothetical protein